jgi:beta-hydroxylase
MELLLSNKMIVLYIFVCSTLYVHYRGTLRYPFFRQLLDHSTFTAPINVWVYLMSRVRNSRYISKDDFPELQTIRDNWETIREEARTLHETGQVIERSHAKDDLAFNSFFMRGWKRFYLKWYQDPPESARRLCPKTVKIVESVPSINGAMFAMLPAGAELGKHRDPYAGSLRYHLGLVTPNSDNCYIVVDNERYSWRDGEDVLFDETYMHFAKNETDKDRIIFFADIARPMRGPISGWVNRQMCRFIGKVSASPNSDEDTTGTFNKIFRYIYKIKEVTRPLKAKHPIPYKITKNALTLLLLYWIFF